MKLSYLLPSLFLTALSAAPESSPTDQSSMEFVSPASVQKQEESFHLETPTFEAQKPLCYFLAYGACSGSWPGGGMGFRTRSPYISFESSTTFIKGSGSEVNEIDVSASLLLRLSRNIDRGMYLGAGYQITMFPWNEWAHEFSPIAFIGYEGKRFFGDLGADIIPLLDSVFPLPRLRMGVRF